MKLNELIENLKKLESKYSGDVKILSYDSSEESMQALTGCKVCSKQEAIKNYYCRGDNDAESYPENTQFLIFF